MKKPFLIFSILTMTSVARAADLGPIVTDRPDWTESTATVPKGMTQIEAGFTLTRSGDERDESFGEILVRRGLNSKSELRLEVPNYAVSRGSGGRASNFSDGSVGFKRVLSAGSDGYGLKNSHVSIIGSASLPLGSRSVRGSGLQPKFKLLLSTALSERFSLSSNLNAAYLKDDDGHFTEFSASTSLGIGINERVGSFVELFGFLPGGKRENSQFINGGLTYLVNDETQLDARVGLGINNDIDGPDHFIGVGLSRRF